MVPQVDFDKLQIKFDNLSKSLKKKDDEIESLIKYINKTKESE